MFIQKKGPSEFTIQGVLENWSVREKNSQVRTPALVLAGEFDTMSQRCHQEVAESLPCAWPVVTVPRAAHCKLIDAPFVCCREIVKFLETIESTRLCTLNSNQDNCQN